MADTSPPCCAPSAPPPASVEASDCCGPSDSVSPVAAAVSDDLTRNDVRDAYAQVALADTAGDSSGTAAGCCGVSDDAAINTLISSRLGYSEDDLESVPKGADLGLGCGNPKAIAALQPGETVVDLGSGAGFDCFLAAQEVGSAGQVIGVDMTPEMISKARVNAAKGGFGSVEFRLGEIEHLPVANNTADVIISNCVINLSPDKPQVFREAYRVLKKNGRLAISDVVATLELPEEMRKDKALIAGCMGNAALISDLAAAMTAAGFVDIQIQPKDASREFIKDWAPGSAVADYVRSATIEARKPAGCC